MIEKTICFGPQDSLFGTVAATGVEAQRAGVGMVMFNAGIVHRIGPHRLNVGIARALIQSGIASIRFDLSGLGDSGRSSSALSYGDQAIADIKSAMDALSEETGASKFLLFGVCSGAAHSYAAALTDDRIAGIVSYDGFRYPTVRSRWNYFALRARQRLRAGTVMTWMAKTIRSRLRSAASLLPRFGGDVSPSLENYAFFSHRPSAHEYAAGLRKMLDRKLKVCMIYAGSAFEHYNYQEQFNDVFVPLGISGGIDVHFLPDGDHTATQISSQKELINLVATWARTQANKF